MVRHGCTPSGEHGFDLIIGVTDTCARRGTTGINLAAQEHIVFPRFALTLDELMTLCGQLKSCLTDASQLQHKLADVLVDHSVA